MKRRTKQNLLEQTKKISNDITCLESIYEDIHNQVSRVAWDSTGTEILKGDWIITPSLDTVKVTGISGAAVLYGFNGGSGHSYSNTCTITTTPPLKWKDRFGNEVKVGDKVLLMGDTGRGLETITKLHTNSTGSPVVSVTNSTNRIAMTLIYSHNMVKVHQLENTSRVFEIGDIVKYMRGTCEYTIVNLNQDGSVYRIESTDSGSHYLPTKTAKLEIVRKHYDK